ncbi:MAG: hypothetical protein U0790_00180 [Isosphaeraceae bacterium]
MFTPVKGKFAHVTDNTTPTPNIYPGVNWTMNIDPKLEDASNFRDGRQRDDNLADADVSMTLIFDQDKPPDKAGSGALGLRAGAAVTLKLYVDNAQTLFYLLPCKVGPVSPKNEGVEKLLKYDVKFFLHGAITYPAYT